MIKCEEGLLGAIDMAFMLLAVVSRVQAESKNEGGKGEKFEEVGERDMKR